MVLGSISFPFTAIPGQEDAKKSILLNLVCPAISGLILIGDRGTGKSTLLRAAACLLPETRLINIPLHIDEEGLLGTAGLGRAVKEGKYGYEEGLLAQAKGDILYVDEINLLPHPLLSLITAAGKNGSIQIEREGLSLKKPTAFLLFGSMNPEEGDLIGGALDYFGHMVRVEGESDEEIRSEIIKRQLAFEQDPQGFAAAFGKKEKEISRRILRAKELYPQVGISPELIKLATKLTERNNCEGHRADLMLIRTAKAAAALDQRKYVSGEDILEAARFVLPHRKRPESEMPPEKSPGEQPGEKTPAPQTSSPASPTSDWDKRYEKKGDDEPDDRKREPQQENGEEEVFAIARDMNASRLLTEKKKVRLPSPGKRNITGRGNSRGRTVGTREAVNGDRDIALTATIRAAVPWQKLRREERRTGATPSPARLLIKAEDLKAKVRQQRSGSLLIFLVDASGSMGAARRMEETKGAIYSLLEESYQKRDRVGMITFRREGAELVLSPTRSVDLAHKKLKDLPVGGGTPLAAGLREARLLFKGVRAKEEELEPVLVILSDGRGNVALNRQERDKSSIRAEIYAEAEAIAREDWRTAVFDTETGWVSLGLARELADRLSADYIRLDDCRSGSIVREAGHYLSPWE